MDNAKVIQVIETTLLKRGNGKDTPVRIITQYWSIDGRLLAEVDPCIKEKQPLNKAEIMAVDRVKILLKDFCSGDVYRTSEGDVNINDFFNKLG